MRSLIAFSALALAACAAETSSPAVADHFEIVQAPTTGIPGRSLDSLVIVRLVDELARPMAGIPVTWTEEGSGGTIHPLTQTTGPDGTVAAQWILGTLADTQSVNITAQDVPALHVRVALGGFRATHLALGTGFACTIDSAGDAWCWGNMGYGWHDFGSTPVKVDSGHALLEITAGTYSACARSAAATYCWGAATDVGQGGPANASLYLPPGPVGGGMGFTTVSTGAYASCATDPAGQAWCWGRDFSGNLGNTGVVHGIATTPVAVAQTGQVFTMISAGYDHTCALEADGTAWCWGHALNHELGDSTVGGSFTALPRRATTDLRFREITVGYGNSCAEAITGGTWCWGVAPPAPQWIASTPDPVRVNGGTYASISLDYEGGVALSNGRPTFWGNPLGFDGGVGGWTSTLAKEIPGGVYGVREIHLDYGTICGIRNDDLVLCWGAVPGYSDPQTQLVLGAPVAIPAP